MFDKFADYKINTKYNKLRIVGFVFSFVLALSAIAFGVSKIIEKPEGYYEIKAQPCEDAANYAVGFEFHYYLSGRSGEIKEQQMRLEEIYSKTLERAYKLTDKYNEYEGYVNIAALNNNPGVSAEISDELAGIIADAYDKTMRCEGYSIFSGALYDHWNSILILDEEAEFDPLLNDEELKRIEALSELVNDSANFSLDIDGDRIIVKTSQAYAEYIADNEESDRMLDLNLLKESYMVKLVADALEKEGFDNGYISTDSGIVYNLSGHGTSGTEEYVFYTVDEIKDNADSAKITAKVSTAGTFNVTKGSCMSGFRMFSFSEDEKLYHIVKEKEEYIFRSPFTNLSSAGSNNVYSSVYSVSASGDVVAATYENIVIINSDRTSDGEELAASENMVTYGYKLP